MPAPAPGSVPLTIPPSRHPALLPAGTDLLYARRAMHAQHPPTILQVLPALKAGGVERGTLEIASAIAQAGWRPLVASAGGRLVPALEALGARHVTLPLTGKSPVALWRNAAALAAVIRQEGVGIVHARSRGPAWSSLLAARRTGAHFVTTYHGTYNENLPGKRFYNSVMARGERVIAISRFIAELLQARHGTDPARIRLIPRGVDTALFDPAAVGPERVAALRAAWAVPEGRPVLLLAARISRWKGQGVLLDALVRLPSPRPFALLLGDAGRGAYAAELRRRAAQLGLEGDIAMPGHCDDLPAAFLLADLALHCSTDAEAFGRSVIEAQAMARPVIAADLGGPRETVAEGETGWRVPPGDAGALADAIARALALPAEERAAIGHRAQAVVRASYTTAAMQRATLDVYRDVLG